MKKSFDPKKTVPMQFSKSIPAVWTNDAAKHFQEISKNPFEAHGGLGKIILETVLTKEGLF